jgi:hypothetical protein
VQRTSGGGGEAGDRHDEQLWRCRRRRRPRGRGRRG